MNQCNQHFLPFQGICIDEKCVLQTLNCTECLKAHICPKLEIQHGIEEFVKKLKIDILPLEKISGQFKEIEIDSFSVFIKQQKQKINEDILEIKQELVKKIDQLENQLLNLLDEQYQVYTRNYNILKQQIQDIDKFKIVRKFSDLNTLMIKLSSNRDPNLTFKKIKTELQLYNQFLSTGKCKQLQEQFFLFQSQTISPPIYKSVELHNMQFQSIICLFDHYSQQMFEIMKDYFKQYPISDFENKIQVRQQKLQMKMIDEEYCISSIIYIKDLIIYTMSDMTLRIRNKQLKELDIINLDQNINIMIEIKDQILKSFPSKLIGKFEYNQQFTLALGGERSIQIWTIRDQQLQFVKEIIPDNMNKCISLINSCHQLLIGDWDGQIFSYNLTTFRFQYLIDTQTQILFSLLQHQLYLVSASKCDMEQGGVILWKLTVKDCVQEKRINIKKVHKIYVDDLIYILDTKSRLYIYDPIKLIVIRMFQVSESYVSDIYFNKGQLFILNQTCLKTIKNDITTTHIYDDFPCTLCRQLYQSQKLIVQDEMMLFIRHFHNCRHEQGDEDKCQMKTNIYLLQ